MAKNSARTSLWRALRELSTSIPTADNRDSRWGVVSILSSFSLFFFSLLFAFWAICISLEGGQRMFPSTLVSAIFFGLVVLCGILGIGTSVYVLRLFLRWHYNHSENITDISQSSIDKISKQVSDSVKTLLNSRGQSEQPTSTEPKKE